MPAVNPLDAWGSGGADAAARHGGLFHVLLADPGAALGAVVHDRAPGGEIYPAYLEYLRAAQRATGKPVCLVANHQGSGSDPRVLAAVAEGMPVIDGMREFLVGARCLLAYRDFLSQDPVADLPAVDPGELAAGGIASNPHRGRRTGGWQHAVGLRYSSGGGMGH